MVCDPGNKSGWSDKAFRQNQDFQTFDHLAARILGGRVKAYDYFEKLRNIEITKLYRSRQIPAICRDSRDSFDAFVDLNITEIREALSGSTVDIEP